MYSMNKRFKYNFHKTPLPLSIPIPRHIYTYTPIQTPFQPPPQEMPPTHQPTYKSIPVLEDMLQNRLMRLSTPSPLLAQDHVSRPTTTPPTQNHATSPSGSSQCTVESVKEYLLDTGYDADDEKEEEQDKHILHLPHPHHHPKPQTEKQKPRIKTSPHNPRYVNPSKKAQPWDDKYPAPPRGF
jgi:hypothetical protein